MAQTSDPSQQTDHVYQDLETAHSELVRLGNLSLEISIALNKEDTLEPILTACTDALVHHLDVALARIWTLNEAENVLELQSSSGMYTHLDGEHARIPVGSLDIGFIASERTPHLTNKVIGDPHISDQEWARREGMVAFAGYPLLVEKRLIGVMAMFARHKLDKATLQVMETIANGIALGIVRLRMRDERLRLLERERLARVEAERAELDLARANQRLQDLNANLESMVAARTEALEQSTEALRQLNTELQRSNQELQDFAYVASHDLQEPLRKIQAFGNLLEEEYGKQLGDGKAYLDRMRNSAGRMRVLIDDLLTFSRVTTKAQPFSPVDLNAVAREVVDDLSPRLQASQGRIELADLPTIEADPRQMYQMLQNLFSNALKFHAPERPPVVRVYAELQGEKEQQCTLFVEDNGIGFDEKYLDRIFTVFQRLHSRSSYEGTGIGLAVVRKIVERHGGIITATSTVGKGSTFIVTLPVFQSDFSSITEGK